MLLIPATYADEFKKEKKNIQFSNTNFYKLEKSSCIECNGEATFEGYFPRVGAIFIPKFVCNNCNRVSCGCQTYEMFHQFYNKCPIDIAKEEKIRFDCGWWPNYKVVTPQGVCPVDGNKIEFWLWEPPQKY
jgi:hypothetical protein